MTDQPSTDGSHVRATPVRWAPTDALPILTDDEADGLPELRFWRADYDPVAERVVVTVDLGRSSAVRGVQIVADGQTVRLVIRGEPEPDPAAFTTAVLRTTSATVALPEPLGGRDLLP